MSEVKPGEETTEYKEVKSAKVWGIVAMVLGGITITGAEIVAALGVTESSKVGVICGAVIAFAGVAQRTLVQLGYIKARAEVKKNQ